MQLYISSLARKWQYKNPIEQIRALYGARKCNMAIIYHFYDKYIKVQWEKPKTTAPRKKKVGHRGNTYQLNYSLSIVGVKDMFVLWLYTHLFPLHDNQCSTLASPGALDVIDSIYDVEFIKRWECIPVIDLVSSTIEFK